MPYLHPDIEWFTHADAPDMGRFEGHDGIRRLAAMLNDVFGEVRLEADQLLDMGDHVVVVGRLQVTGTGSGAATESGRTWVYSLRDGMIVRHLTFATEAEALETVAPRVGAGRASRPRYPLMSRRRRFAPGTSVRQVRRFLEDQREPFEEVVLESQEFFERGDQIVVFVLVRLRPRGSSAVVESRIGHLWTMSDGKAVRCESFAVRAEALKQPACRSRRCRRRTSSSSRPFSQAVSTSSRSSHRNSKLRRRTTRTQSSFTGIWKCSSSHVARHSRAPYIAALKGSRKRGENGSRPGPVTGSRSTKFVDAGDKVVVFVRVAARTARDDVLMHHTPGAIWTIRAGKVASIRFYYDRSEALEAAGLKE